MRLASIVVLWLILVVVVMGIVLVELVSKIGAHACPQ